VAQGARHKAQGNNLKFEISNSISLGPAPCALRLLIDLNGLKLNK
jgi:hypothetical protein